MRRRKIAFSQFARDDLYDIYRYVRQQSGSGKIAKTYLARIEDRCRRIGDAPYGGVARHDLGDDIRMTVFERRIVILYRVEDDTVWITSIFSGSRDYEALLGGRGDSLPDDG